MDTAIQPDLPDGPVPNEATEARDCVPLMFLEIELEDVREGMTLRFQRMDEPTWGTGPATGVSVVRREIFSPMDEALVVDAEDMHGFRVSALYRDYRVSALTTAIY